MKRHYLIVIVALLFGIAGAFVYRELGNSHKETDGLNGGEIDAAAVMAAVLPDLDNKPQALKQWQGKVLIVNFWAPWCPPCREEIPGFISLQKKYGGQGLVFVGIALDELSRVQSYVDEIGINYPTLIGGPEAGQLSTEAGNRLGGLPYTLVLDRAGKPIANFTGAVAEKKLEALITPLL